MAKYKVKGDLKEIGGKKVAEDGTVDMEQEEALYYESIGKLEASKSVKKTASSGE